MSRKIEDGRNTGKVPNSQGRCANIAAFFRSRLRTLLLWNGGLLLAAAVLRLSPDLAWPVAELLYALLLNLAAQAAWLAFEALARTRLRKQLQADDFDYAHLSAVELSDQDLLVAELQDFKKRLGRKTQAEHTKLQAYEDYIVAWVHELKTPLTALRLGMEQSAQTATAEKRQEAEALLGELGTMEQLVQQALFYARSESFALDYQARPLQLPALIKKLLAANARRCIRHKLRPCFGAGFAAAEAKPAEWTVLSDPVWLQFMLQQILANSLKYAPIGSRLMVNLERSQSSIILHLTDQGPGVPPEELDAIFYRGFAGQKRDKPGRINASTTITNTDTVSTGAAASLAASTGMGLYLVKNLADKLGHRVWANAATEPPGLRINISFADPPAFPSNLTKM